MRESGEPMEFGIFDFYKVFSKAFGEVEDGAGDLNGREGISSLLGLRFAKVGASWD